MPEFGVIEDVPAVRREFDGRVKNGFTRALFAMQVGQSALFDMTYVSAHNTISKARRRKISKPLTGKFVVVREGNGVRVGRVE